jgi:membrane protein
MHAVKHTGMLLKETFMQWKERDPFNNSAIISYYTIFSLPGLLVIIINIAGYFFDQNQITARISNQVQAIMGGDTAQVIQSIMIQASEAKRSILSSIFGVGTLLFGATGVFYELQQMFNRIWNIEPKPKTREKIWMLVVERIFSLGLVLVVGFLLLVSLVLSAGLSAFSAWVSLHFSESTNIIFQFIDALLSLSVITVLFAAMFKFMPKAKIKWKDVWAGAFLTAMLFVVAKFAIGFYIGQSNVGSTYGAASTIVLIMVWISYAGLIFLFGAEFTHVYIMNKYDIRIKPTAQEVATISK